jgi:hypothetical protein
MGIQCFLPSQRKVIMGVGVAVEQLFALNFPFSVIRGLFIMPLLVRLWQFGAKQWLSMWCG